MTYSAKVPETVRVDAARMRFHAYDDEAAMTKAASAAILDAVSVDLQRQDQALLLLSGGTTPVPVYRAVAARLAAIRGLTGNATGGLTRVITIGLVDERWVAPDSPGSNAAMIRETLLAGAQGGANKAAIEGANVDANEGVRFWPLVDWSRERAHSVALANERLQSIGVAPSLVLFGMGDDGHTASLFPGSPQLDSALASADAYVALDAQGCPGAGKWPQRITLTPRGWMHARRRMLLMRGAHKREILERAALHHDTPTDARLFPVSAAIAIGDAPLDVHWCP